MLSNRPIGMRRTFGADRTNHVVSNSNNNNNIKPSSENHHVAIQKTPGAAAKTPSRRRALGDISNRKKFGAPTSQKQRGVSFASSATKSVSKSVLPSRSSAGTNKAIMAPKPVVKATTTPRAVSFAPPIEDVEFRAGRPYDPFDHDVEYDFDISVDLSIDGEMLTANNRSSGVPRKNTPGFWLSTFDTTYPDDTIDDTSVLMMMAPDDIESLDSCIDISLEEEVNFLGTAVLDFSF